MLEDAGLPRPLSQDVGEFAILNASAELISKMGGDAIFLTTYGPEDESTKQEIMSDPLWQQLEAVQQGNIYEVSPTTCGCSASATLRPTASWTT